MQFEGAVIREQGITFGVLIVQHHVIRNRAEADRVIRTCRAQVFPGMLVVLMAQNARGVPTYYGRPDISRFMASVPLRAVVWRRFTLS